MISPVYRTWGKGYLLSDIRSYLPLERYEKFVRWFAGQTGMLEPNGDVIVYADDFERWLSDEDAPVFD